MRMVPFDSRFLPFLKDIKVVHIVLESTELHSIENLMLARNFWTNVYVLGNVFNSDTLESLDFAFIMECFFRSAIQVIHS